VVVGYSSCFLSASFLFPFFPFFLPFSFFPFFWQLTNQRSRKKGKKKRKAERKKERKKEAESKKQKEDVTYVLIPVKTNCQFSLLSPLRIFHSKKEKAMSF
jgi:flagellar biosynthesis component FlhA